METGDDGVSGILVINHVVMASERGQDRAVTLRLNMEAKTVQELIHNIECVT